MAVKTGSGNNVLSVTVERWRFQP